jgi:hypothetical protein
MGAIKQQVIAEQDREWNEIVSVRAVRVPRSGGDSMSNSFLAQLDALISGASEPASEPPPASSDLAEIAQAEEAAAAAEEGREEQAVQLEKDFDRQERAAIQAESAPEVEAPAVQAAPAAQAETAEQKARRLELSKAIVGAISTEKMVHGTMVLNGIAEKCISCGMPLTDALSIQRCLGPDCAGKGYAEDPIDSDEMGAMIELAEYPALVEFLIEHYKPFGLRGLMNGLVRIAALNRKSPVHPACCNAIEMLGYGRLANTLRNSLVIGQIKDSKLHAGNHHVWIKRASWTREFGRACGAIPRAFFDRVEKGWIVPKHPAARVALWRVLMEHYSHEAIKTNSGPVKIPTLEEWAAKHKK